MHTHIRTHTNTRARTYTYTNTRIQFEMDTMSCLSRILQAFFSRSPMSTCDSYDDIAAFTYSRSWICGFWVLKREIFWPLPTRVWYLTLIDTRILPRLTHSIRGCWLPLTLPSVSCRQSNMSVAYGKYSIKPCKKGNIVTEVGGEKIDLNEARKRIKLGKPQKICSVGII